jgi:hypothetical protein
LLQANLHLISTIAIFSAAIIPIYICINIKSGNKLQIRALTLTLTIFIIIHGVYHIFGFFGYTLIAEGFFKPLSVIILILFAILMVRILHPNSLAVLRKQKGGFNYI